LKEWKTAREGTANRMLSKLVVPDTDSLMEMLTKIARPPLDRLEVITRRLEDTGTVTADTVSELKLIISMMSQTAAGVDAHTARTLSQAADVFSGSTFSRSARDLARAAEVLPDVVSRMRKLLPPQ
jgi:hypothetical protein